MNKENDEKIHKIAETAIFSILKYRGTRDGFSFRLRDEAFYRLRDEVSEARGD